MLNSLVFRLASSKASQRDSRLVDSLFSLDLLSPLRQWLNTIPLRNPVQAHLICRLIPAQCPFAREVRIGHLIRIQVPPLCKLNPLYEEVVSLRFRALCYLAEEYPADLSRYC